MDELVDFLAGLPIFEELSSDELYDLAALCQEYSFQRGSVIAYQRDVADSLYLIRSGRLYAHNVDASGHIINTVSYQSGQYFLDSWLFAPAAHPATVKAASDGRLVVITGSRFLTFLDSHKRALPKLEPIYDEFDNVIAGLSEEAWQEANKMTLKADRRSIAISLLPDELVEYLSRRSRWFLVLRIFWPLLGLLLVPAATYLFLVATFANVGQLAIVVTLLLIGVFLLLMGFQALDWSNDYFIITNKHLAHREFVLSIRQIRANVVKIPIDQIQSVEVAKPTFLSNLLNIGTARITTAAQAGTIYFDNIDNPMEVKETLNRLRQRVQALGAGRDQAIMRQSIESHFQVPVSLEAVTSPEAQATTTEGSSGFLAELIKGYRSRVEEKGVVTYRKHPFVLLQAIAAPTGVLLLLIVLYFALTRVSTIPRPETFWGDAFVVYD